MYRVLYEQTVTNTRVTRGATTLVAGPPDADKPTPPGNPLASDAAARLRVDTAFDAALAGYERPEGVDDATQWRRWVDVRDAVKPGHRQGGRYRVGGGGRGESKRRKRRPIHN